MLELNSGKGEFSPLSLRKDGSFFKNRVIGLKTVTDNKNKPRMLIRGLSLFPLFDLSSDNCSGIIVTYLSYVNFYSQVLNRFPKSLRITQEL